MKDMGLQGIIRGNLHKTTIPDKSAPCPLDKVNRQFRGPAPDLLWGEADQQTIRGIVGLPNDFTSVAT